MVIIMRNGMATQVQILDYAVSILYGIWEKYASKYPPASYEWIVG